MTAIVIAPSNGITLADTVPKAEAKVAVPGAMEQASRGDHTHPRLTSATNVTLDANGYATIVFTRTFTTEPVLVFGALGTGTGPVPDFRGELVQTGALYTGVIVYGQRNRALPTLAAVNTGLLTIAPLITGLNTLFASISGFAPFEAAAGARVSVTAIQAS